MLLIDSVGVDNGCAMAFAVVKPDWVVLDDENEVSDSAFFEIMAQGYAAICAVLARTGQNGAEKRSELGFLVGVKNFEILGTAKPGDMLSITAINHNSIGPFHVFDASVYKDTDLLLATGQIKVFLTDAGSLGASEPSGIESGN